MITGDRNILMKQEEEEKSQLIEANHNKTREGSENFRIPKN